MSSHNRNPSGRNQHGGTLQADDDALIRALQGYHREQMSNNLKISERLHADHGINMSETTVKRRRKKLGLTGSGATTKSLSRQNIEQIVINQLQNDPAKHHGIRTVQHKIAHNEGIHLTRDIVSEVMHMHAPEGFALRDPTAKKIFRVPKVPIGIHERWAGDGHDKLYKIGFPIWAVVDDATGKWMGAWVVPSNRVAKIIAYLFLCLVEKYEGIPLQFSTDCGTETTELYGLVNALRSRFHSEYDLSILPPHVYLRSVHNISIERSWLRLRTEFGDNVVLVFFKGVQDGFYKPHDTNHLELCQWLWPKLLRSDLQEFMDSRNSARMRKNNDKAGPSGMSRNEAFSLPRAWGGRNCLLPVDPDIIRAIKAEIGDDTLLEFVSDGFARRAQAAYDTLAISKLTLQNIWFDFPLLSESKCGRCKAIENKSTVEGLAERNKPQCLSCGLSGAILQQNVICNGCVEHWRVSEYIPQSVLKLPGIITLVLDKCTTDGSRSSDNHQELASSVVEAASQFQRKASNTRLAMNPSLNRAVAVNEERKKKAALNEIKDAIRISASLWEISDAHSKMAILPNIRITTTCSPSQYIRAALDELLNQLRNEFAHSHPLTEVLDWGNVTLYAHENAGTFSCLKRPTSDETVQQFFNKFLSLRWGTKATLKARSIEVRIVYNRGDIFIANDSEDENNLTSDAFHNKKRKKLSVGTGRETHKRSQPILRSAFFPPQNTAESDPVTIWSRNPPMVQYSFTQRIAQYSKGKVTFKECEGSEKVDIASDWLAGQKLANEKKPHWSTGFIGEGYTKTGVYARIGEREYCLMLFSLDHTGTATHSQTDAEVLLQEEFQLLCICDTIKGEFDHHAKECKIRVPQFYFNYKNAVFGKIKRTETGSVVPYHYFIATLLLPCGELDAKLIKYSGNDYIGKADDPVTQSVHAFAHFSLVYTSQYLLLCDLQGIPDGNGIPCLIDPQCHTMSTNSNTKVYWDGGPKQIKNFVDQHVESGMCSKNPICNALQIANTKVEVSATPSPEKAGKKPLRIGFTPTKTNGG